MSEPKEIFEYVITETNKFTPSWPKPVPPTPEHRPVAMSYDGGVAFVMWARKVPAKS